MKISRQPRKQIKLKDAANKLQCSVGTVRNLIYIEKRLQFRQRKPGTTSPLKVYEAEVNEVAREWGILT